MSSNKVPGVSRVNRISAEGLQRLEKQLQAGRGASEVVLRQWIHRYGDEAREIIKKHGQYDSSLDV